MAHQTAIPGRQIARALRFARPVLARRLDDAATAAVLASMRARYADLAPAVPRLRAPTSRMTLRLGVDALAFYRALGDRVPQAERLALTQAFVDIWMDGQFDTWIARAVYGNRLLHRLYRRWWVWSANRADEADGWRFTYVPPRGALYYGIDVTRCGIVTFLARQGAAELAPVLCRGDLRIRKHLPRGVEFRRTGVLAEGAPVCDFRYYASPPGRGKADVPVPVPATMTTASGADASRPRNRAAAVWVSRSRRACSAAIRRCSVTWPFTSR
jgi:hypothetical protein